ncbi:MAG: hypothetical protein Q9197_005507 [Variospora fuerteventurae]
MSSSTVDPGSETDSSVHSDDNSQDGDASLDSQEEHDGFLLSQQLYDELLTSIHPPSPTPDSSTSPTSRSSSPSSHTSVSYPHPHSLVSQGTHRRVTAQRLFIVLFLVAIYYALYYALSHQDVIDTILVRFQQPIEKACTTAQDRLEYHAHFPYNNGADEHSSIVTFHDPALNRTPCIPKLCPGTLSFLSHPDPYAVLGLRQPPYGPGSPAPTRLDIRRAFRTHTSLYHPDKSQAYLEPDTATYITGIYTKHLRTLLDDVGKERFAKEWVSGQAQRHTAEYLRERSQQEFGPVDKWTVIREIRIHLLSAETRKIYHPKEVVCWNESFDKEAQAPLWNCQDRDALPSRHVWLKDFHIEKGRATVSTCCAIASDHPPLLFPLIPCMVYLADRPPSSSSSPGGISWAPETFDPSSYTIDVTYAFTDHGRLAYERAQTQNPWWETALVLAVVVPLAVMMVSAVKGAGLAEPERQPEEAETERQPERQQPKRQSGALTGRRQPLPRAASARKR